VGARRRSHLADAIETAENMDFAKQQVLLALEQGKKTLLDLAIEQTGTKKVRRRRVQA
jgi:hypothetical protein